MIERLYEENYAHVAFKKFLKFLYQLHKRTFFLSPLSGSHRVVGSSFYLVQLKRKSWMKVSYIRNLCTGVKEKSLGKTHKNVNNLIIHNFIHMYICMYKL